MAVVEAPGVKAGALADAATGFDLDGAWRLDPQVALRPEPFGALAYHFGTRRLSFLKSRVLVDVVVALADRSSARQACREAGVGERELERYGRALATLAESGMIAPRVPA
ncbi:MAG: mftB [Solirubrobacterales bacterium]|jgi:putative mycofactocin binding protein MftB|nr:mftB [Solirubrobacterales bacterium]